MKIAISENALGKNLTLNAFEACNIKYKWRVQDAISWIQKSEEEKVGFLSWNCGYFILDCHVSEKVD